MYNTIAQTLTQLWKDITDANNEYNDKAKEIHKEYAPNGVAFTNLMQEIAEKRDSALENAHTRAKAQIDGTFKTMRHNVEEIASEPMTAALDVMVNAIKDSRDMDTAELTVMVPAVGKNYIAARILYNDCKRVNTAYSFLNLSEIINSLDKAYSIAIACANVAAPDGSYSFRNVASGNRFEEYQEEYNRFCGHEFLRLRIDEDAE